MNCADCITFAPEPTTGERGSSDFLCRGGGAGTLIVIDVSGQFVN
jgi:hypothetical protein